MMDDDNDPYTRWQGFRIAQLGLCISLFLAFSIAILGFAINLLVQQRFEITACYAKVTFLLSIILGLLSIFFGSVACLTRLADFRLTARVVRHRDDAKMAAEVAHWRLCYKRFGKWSWRMFVCQLLAFACQVLCLAMSLGITYGKRLL